MAELNNLMRLLVQADKEYKITNVTASDITTKHTSQLTSGYKRKGIAAYNNSNDLSGECFWGDSNLTYSANGMPIPKGAIIEIPLSTDLDIYFCSASGEVGDLRVIEIA